MYDVVIVGGGPAGLSAALVLGRARQRVAVVDAGEPRNARAAESHGFLTRDGVAPAELLRIGREEVRGYGVELVEDRVVAAAPGFRVALASGATLEARRLLVTTGLRDELPDIPGMAELWGGDVHVCPYCHGYEVRDRPLGIVADGPMGVLKALLVRQWSEDVVLFPGDYVPTPEEDARLAARSVPVEPGKITRLVVEDGALTGVELGDGRMVPRAAVFTNPTNVATDTMLRDLGCEVDDQGIVRVDAAGRTTVPGVWAAGNVVDPHAQLITAAGAGSRTAGMLNNELVLGPQG
ncbi:MAG: FAD-binding protein [Actinophytocola sp.]|uniref:NAD(P)/FAD-dependent oxidoreductase n=1 Tax=Actinophytocola sp. TaxID=1872138 RepID=UPI001321A093|nr:NAD(P)/FAD-dependent oxidoreductase [Actinophytocola sp.]MPZ86023.1 FAD-binding protein [Actinophytocola sp.]